MEKTRAMLLHMDVRLLVALFSRIDNPNEIELKPLAKEVILKGGDHG